MKVVVVSPHLDDAVLSVGATMHHLSAKGVDVQLVTVFGGDTERPSASSYWDAKRGLEDKGAVIEERRAEDKAAAAVLGAEPIWLPFDDAAYVAPRDPDAIWSMLAPLLATADAVLVPGWPLHHADHRYATMLVLERLRSVPVGGYSEMPYAASPLTWLKGMVRHRSSPIVGRARGAELVWSAAETSTGDFAAKRRAVECYRGELEALGLEARLAALHDRLHRRESIGWFPDAMPPSDLFGGVR